MSGQAVASPDRLDRRLAIAEALRSRWRLFDRVVLRAAPDGAGFQATIQLDTTIVRGAAEQQGTNRSPALMSRAEERRRRAIAECIESFNAGLPPAERITEFQLVP